MPPPQDSTSSTTRIMHNKVLMLADFPTHTPLLDKTNQLMQHDVEVNLPKWILNDI